MVGHWQGRNNDGDGGARARSIIIFVLLDLHLLVVHLVLVVGHWQGRNNDGDGGARARGIIIFVLMAGENITSLGERAQDSTAARNAHAAAGRDSCIKSGACSAYFPSPLIRESKLSRLVICPSGLADREEGKPGMSQGALTGASMIDIKLN